MKQPGVLLVLVIFVAAVSFVVASQEFKYGGTKTAQLSGSNVVNSIGDADGTGVLEVTVRADEGKFCYGLSLTNISTASSVTLNYGLKGTNGPQVAILQTPSQAKGSSVDCVALDADRIGDIMRNPASYYVNVQNAEFPNGAVRGQLK